MSKSITIFLGIISILVLALPLQAQSTQYINLGSTDGSCGDFSDSQLRNIAVSGTVYARPATSAFGDNIGIVETTAAIRTAKSNECVYQTALEGQNETDLNITICDLPQGESLSLTLYFAEFNKSVNGSGQRQFDILINEFLRTSQFDIWAEGNAKHQTLNQNLRNGGIYIAVNQTYSVTANSSGCVEIRLRADVRNPLISAASITAATTFPVEMLSFEASKSGENTALLNWSTAQEINNAGFEVQYSRNGVDFASAGYVKGAGTTSEIQNYQFEIHALTPGTYNFRLRQIDYDGAYVFSQQVELELNHAQGFHVSSIYPNPASETAYLYLSVEERQAVKLQVFNLRGQLVATAFNRVMDAGQAREIAMDLSSLSPGIYTVQVRGSKFRKTYKLQVR